MRGKLGGDGDWATEALAFGFMTENTDHGIVLRIWSLAVAGNEIAGRETRGRCLARILPEETRRYERMTIRFVAFHSPGPNWQDDVPFFEQRAVGEHVAHYEASLEAGHLERGGPFTDSSGGMQIFAPSVERSLAEEIAHADPAVQSGLLRVDVRPWFMAMHPNA